MVTLILADDDPIILQGLSMIMETQPDLALLGAAQDGMQAVALCREHKPDVALLDIRMPRMNGIEAARVILGEELSIPLFFTTFDEPEFIAQALKLGVGGYILKNSPAQRVISSIHTVAQGGTVFQQDIVDYFRDMNLVPNDTGFDGLTPRETEVVRYIAKGLSNAEIAETMFLSNGTVRNHISTILEKTGLTHRTQIAVRYLGGRQTAMY